MTEMSALGIRVTGDGITKTTAELDAFTAAAIKAASAASKPINTAGGGGGAAALTAVTTATKSLSSAQVTATATTQGASGALHEMAAKIAATEAALSRQTAAEKAAAAATASHASSLGAVSPALAAYAARATAAATTSQKITAVAGQQKQGLQQLSFQINDVATQFASGTPPMQIFAQQAGQTVQAVQLMVGGTSKLAAFLGGPWGIAVVAATVVLVPFIGRLWESKTAADSARVSLDSLIAKYKQAQGERAKFETAGADLAKQIAERDRLQTQLNTARTNSGNPNAFAYGSEAKRIKELNVLIGQGRAAIDAERTSTFHLDKSAGDLAYSLGQVKTETVGATGAAQGHTAAIKESNAAYDQAFNAAQSYIDQLEQQNAEFGKTEKEIRLMEVARRIDAAATDEQRAAIKRLSDTREMQIGIDELAKGDAWRKSHIADIQREIDLLGMEGEARARASLALEEEGFKAEALKNHVLDVNGAWDEYQSKQLDLINGQSFLDGEAEKAAVLLDRVNALSGAMNGGIFGGITGALNSRDPIASLLGSGGIGSLIGLSTGGGREAYQAQAEIISKSLEKVFGVSGPFATMLAGALQGSSLGSLGSSLVGGNSTGGAIGGALGGALMSGGLGKSITKGLTGALGEALGGALSSAIPVIGGIAGSLLGNLLKKDKWGSTIVSAGGSQGTFGNSGTSRAGSSSLAAAFNETLGKLATSLDATLGEFAVSIGVTNGKINVNPGAVSGMIGTTKQSDTIDFGEDQAAALKYAIQNAIEDGALVGLSEGWKKFLLASDNVEAQYQKLSNLQSAYDELDSIKNPQAFALASLDKAFNALRDTAYRAGDDMVRIEELYQLKRAEVIEDANSDALELLRTNRSVEIEIMQLEGKSVEALSAARLMEQEGLDASTIALMTRRNALQDEAAITEKAAEATRLLEEARKSELDSLLSLRERLFTARGDDTGLRNFQRALEYEKASAAEREALDQIYKAEDAARNAAAAAQSRAEAEAKAADIAAAKSSLQIELLRALGDEEAAVALERKKALDATDASLRSLQMQVWAAQDAAKALDEAKASFGQFATSLREFRDQLIAGDQATADAYRAAQVKFMTTAALAATGDVTALGKLQGVSESFLSASRDRATSQLQVDRDKAAVLQALNAGIDVSDDRVDAANAQLEAVREGNSAILALTAESKRGNDNAQVERVAIKSDLGVLRRLLTSLEQDGALRVTVAEID